MIGQIAWYDYIWKYLVPYGYAVALPDSYNIDTTDNTMPFARDILYILEFLMNESNYNSLSIFYQMFNGKSAVSGHSMGGASALVALTNIVSNFYNQTFNYR